MNVETPAPAPDATANVEPVTEAVVAPAAVEAGDPPAGEVVPEIKPEGATEGEVPAADPPAAEAAEGAPEAYADFTLPEGMTLEPTAAAEFQTLAKASNLSQEGAQKLVDLAAGLVARTQQETMEGMQAHAAETFEKWLTDAKADPLVGGVKFDESVKVAQAAVAQFGDADLKAAFEEFHLGNHPAFLRFAYRVGKAAAEGGFVDGQGSEIAAASGGTEEERLAARVRAEQARNPVKTPRPEAR